ncbi:HAD family hydrolase [Streptomyces cavernicola]|uniref:phosphoserine phosphatase n=1 Tax=Streptomyces cavernicola TaxID=3043613 RepID=A0ABT6SBR8_9ACTN|nr:haloacid dehalogenase-like hydrolase [Streptomyces sp. B-S-A6]MDI3405646.1 haloacid dehalogenase-like hydrolase [Streptomyces sp. B-S-A6]
MPKVSDWRPGRAVTKVRPARLLAVIALAVALIVGATTLWPRGEATAAETGGTGGRASAQLKHWPQAVRAELAELMDKNAHQGRYAVFDADNTTYHHDLEEALLPYLEMKGVLTRATMDPSLKVIPFKDTADHRESLYSYYVRLCEIDDQVCYPWVAQIFSGFTLKELKGHVDDLMAYGKPIPAEYYDDNGRPTPTEVEPPELRTGMQELYQALRDNGIEVYVVSAASEELVRMVLADPKYGYGVKPENVIGVTMQLQNRRTGDVTTARQRIAQGNYDPAQLADWELTPRLWAPLTWYHGKPAAISEYIDEWKKPILVGGDTPASDGPMLFHSLDVDRGGARVWVNRKDKYLTQIQEMQRKNAAAQREAGLKVTADKRWFVVTPEEVA